MAGCPETGLGKKLAIFNSKQRTACPKALQCYVPCRLADACVARGLFPVHAAIVNVHTGVRRWAVVPVKLVVTPAPDKHADVAVDERVCRAHAKRVVSKTITFQECGRLQGQGYGYGVWLVFLRFSTRTHCCRFPSQTSGRLGLCATSGQVRSAPLRPGHC